MVVDVESHDRMREAFAKMEPTSLVITSPLTAPLSLCFDWEQVYSRLVELLGRIDRSAVPAADPLSKLYMVVFRSKRQAGADSQLLYAADEDAHQEAKLSGGLLLYWYGSLNDRRECFATCIWKSREDASKAAKLPKHLIATSLASQMYDFYQLEKYWLTFDNHGRPLFEQVN